MQQTRRYWSSGEARTMPVREAWLCMTYHPPDRLRPSNYTTIRT